MTLSAWRKSGSFLLLQLGAASLAFATYFCMYAFRKPFAAGEYVGAGLFGLDLKTTFVISQVLGYALSKYIGVKVVSEAPRQRRLPLLLGLVFGAELALVGFAVLPGPWKALSLFLNGLPLGMVWGLVVRYLEGRRASEFLLSALSCSFIVASGVVKDVGRGLLRAGVDEVWMPALVGLAFLLPFAAFAGLLDRVPDPDAEDVRRREERPPMSLPDRRRFTARFLPGIALLLGVYLGLTAYRDFRDNYGVEVFEELGYGATPALFTSTEVPVAILVLVLLASLGLIQDRRRGLSSVFLVMTAGLLLIGLATFALDARWIAGDQWMIAIGVGVYLAYVPFSSFLFDRIMAATHFAGTAVFAINLADAVGYTGSVLVQLYKDLDHAELSRFQFLKGASYGLGLGGALVLGLAAVYFARQARSATRQASR